MRTFPKFPPPGSPERAALRGKYEEALKARGRLTLAEAATIARELGTADIDAAVMAVALEVPGMRVFAVDYTGPAPRVLSYAELLAAYEARAEDGGRYCASVEAVFATCESAALPRKGDA